jgi:hypothetical protein
MRGEAKGARQGGQIILLTGHNPSILVRPSRSLLDGRGNAVALATVARLGEAADVSP